MTYGPELSNTDFLDYGQHSVVQPRHQHTKNEAKY
jgi:hypothetical protein